MVAHFWMHWKTISSVPEGDPGRVALERVVSVAKTRAVEIMGILSRVGALGCWSNEWTWNTENSSVTKAKFCSA